MSTSFAGADSIARMTSAELQDMVNRAAADQVRSFLTSAALREQAVPGSLPRRTLDDIPLVTTLPRKPRKLDECYFIPDELADIYWHFIYLPGGSFPWKFIGGSALLDQVDTPETTASTTYTVLATAGPAITLPLAGIYRVTGKVMHSNATANVLDYMSFDIGTTGALDIDAARGISTTNAGNVHVERTRDYTVSAGTVLTAKYRTGSSTATFERRLLTALPIRVG